MKRPVSKILKRSHTVEAPSGTKYANGDIHCKAQDDRIDRHVCIARTIETPEKCSGCPLNL
jgi:hypothetical protein